MSVIVPSFFGLLAVAVLVGLGILVIVALARNPSALKVVAVLGGVVLAFFVLAAVGWFFAMTSRTEVMRQDEATVVQRATEVRLREKRRGVPVPRGTAGTEAVVHSGDGPTVEIRKNRNAGEVGTSRTGSVTSRRRSPQAPPHPERPRLPRPSRPKHRYATRVEAPDDGAAWKRDSILGWEPLAGDKLSWNETWHEDAAGSRKLAGARGDTYFDYWEPGPTGHIVGYSGVEATLEDAKRAAVNAAGRKLAVLALIRVHEETPNLDVSTVEPLALDLSTRERTVPPECDVYFDRAETSGEFVYRVAVRLDAGEEKIRSLAQRVEQEVNRGWIRKQNELKTWVVTSVSLLFLAFAVFLIYTFLNAGTKGHFAWPLRLVSMFVFALLCVAIIYARSHLGIG